MIAFAVAYSHSQQADDFEVDDTQLLSTIANDYKNTHSIKSQMLDNLTDEEPALYYALTGETS